MNKKESREYAAKLVGMTLQELAEEWDNVTKPFKLLTEKKNAKKAR